MKKMKEMKGGVVAREGYTYFTALMAMIDHPLCIVKLVYDKSITGWILRLELNSDDFFFIATRKDTRSTPVKSIIIKLCIIKLSSLFINAIHLNIGRNQLTKQLLLSSQLLNEAKIQQEIYMKTFLVSGLPVTPAIIYVAVFNDTPVSYEFGGKQITTNALNMFLDKLLARCEGDDHTTKGSITFLKQILTDPYFQLGLIAMESIDSTFKTFKELIELEKDLKTEANREFKQTIAQAQEAHNKFLKIFKEDINHAAAQIIKTVVLSEKINADSHSGNILGCIEERPNKTVLLDWERNVDIGKYIQYRKDVENGGNENHKNYSTYKIFKNLYDNFIKKTQRWFLKQENIYIFNFDEMLTLINIMDIHVFINMTNDDMCMIYVLQFLLFVIFVDCVYKNITNNEDREFCPVPQCSTIMSNFFVIKKKTKDEKQSLLIIPIQKILNTVSPDVSSLVDVSNKKKKTDTVMSTDDDDDDDVDVDDVDDSDWIYINSESTLSSELGSSSESSLSSESGSSSESISSSSSPDEIEIEIDSELEPHRFKIIYQIFSKITNAGELKIDTDGTAQFGPNDKLIEKMFDPKIYAVSIIILNGLPKIKSEEISLQNNSHNWQTDFNKWQQKISRKKETKKRTRSYKDEFEEYYDSTKAKPRYEEPTKIEAPIGDKVLEIPTREKLKTWWGRSVWEKIKQAVGFKGGSNKNYKTIKNKKHKNRKTIKKQPKI